MVRISQSTLDQIVVGEDYTLSPDGRRNIWAVNGPDNRPMLCRVGNQPEKICVTVHENRITHSLEQLMDLITPLDNHIAPPDQDPDNPVITPPIKGYIPGYTPEVNAALSKTGTKVGTKMCKGGKRMKKKRRKLTQAEKKARLDKMRAKEAAMKKEADNNRPAVEEN